MSEINLNELYEKGIKMHHITNTAYPLTPGSFMRYKVTGARKIKELLQSDLDKLEAISLYIHIPFCQSRCKFCEYAVVSGDDALKKEQYVDALLKEMDMYKEIIGDKKILGFDMGGGTPTQLETDQIKRITERLHQNFNLIPRLRWVLKQLQLLLQEI